MKEDMIIDIKEICRRILKMWKILLIAAIVGAILLNVVVYIQSYKNYAKEQLSDGATIEKYKSELSETEIEDVKQAYDTYVICKKQYESELEYNQNSMLMKLGNDNVATVEMQYYIDNHYKSVYPVIEQKNNAADIIEAYRFYLLSEDVLNEIKENIGTDIDERDLRELIRIEPIENSQTMKISIYTDSKDATNEIADAIQQKIESYTMDIQEQYGGFDLVGANRYESTQLDETILELQQKEIATINVLKTQIDTIGNDFTDAKLVYYNALINDSETNSDSKKENFQLNILNAKNILLGCVAGIVIVVCYVVAKYLLQRKLRNQNDLQDLYHSYTFGIITDLKKDLENGLIEQILAVTIRRKIYCVGLIGTDTSKETQDVFDMIASRLKNENIDVCSAYGCDKVPKLLKDNEMINQVIIIEKKNGSTYENIENEIKLCEQCNVQILGNIIVDIG